MMGVLESFSKLFRGSAARLAKLKLVVSDIDGTILNDDGDVYDSTVSLIRRLADLGVEFMLATGRTHHTAEEVLELLGEQRDCIAFDGAVILCPNSGDAHVEHISAEDRLHIAEQCSMTDLSITAIDMNCYTTFGKPYSPDHLHHENIDLRVVDSLREVFLQPAFRYYGIGTRASVEFLQRALATHTPELVVNGRESHRLAGSSIVEIRLRECDKGTALKRYVEQRSLKSSEIAVVGDYRNDLPMFHKDYFCVALSNAVAELRAKADLVTQRDSHNAGIDEFLSAVITAKEQA